MKYYVWQVHYAEDTPDITKLAFAIEALIHEVSRWMTLDDDEKSPAMMKHMEAIDIARGIIEHNNEREIQNG